LRQSELVERMAKTNTLEPDRAAARPPSHLCYSPTVFFRNIRLISLSFPQGKIRRVFKKMLQVGCFYPFKPAKSEIQ
jgi:hypothetical protein